MRLRGASRTTDAALGNAASKLSSVRPLSPADKAQMLSSAANKPFYVSFLTRFSGLILSTLAFPAAFAAVFMVQGASAFQNLLNGIASGERDAWTTLTLGAVFTLTSALCVSHITKTLQGDAREEANARDIAALTASVNEMRLTVDRLLAKGHDLGPLISNEISTRLSERNGDAVTPLHNMPHIWRGFVGAYTAVNPAFLFDVTRDEHADGSWSLSADERRLETYIERFRRGGELNRFRVVLFSGKGAEARTIDQVQRLLFLCASVEEEARARGVDVDMEKLRVYFVPDDSPGVGAFFVGTRRGFGSERRFAYEYTSWQHFRVGSGATDQLLQQRTTEAQIQDLHNRAEQFCQRGVAMTLLELRTRFGADGPTRQGMRVRDGAPAKNDYDPIIESGDHITLR